MHHFTDHEVLPGVHHITDAMGVCFTLLVGEKEALCVDAGYGLFDVASYLRTLTKLPLRLLITHGHHDHALGAMWFDQYFIFPGDEADIALYTGREKRRDILLQAKAKGIVADEEQYLSREMPKPTILQETTFDLGGFSVQVLHVPGHTPASAVCCIPEKQLLLSADNWNPCTWLFFPAALPAEEFRKNQRERLSSLPFTQVLCSHQPHLYPREKWQSFFDGLTDEALKAAPPVDTGKAMGIDTHQASPAPDQIFVFDYQKTAFADKGR